MDWRCQLDAHIVIISLSTPRETRARSFGQPGVTRFPKIGIVFGMAGQRFAAALALLRRAAALQRESIKNKLKVYDSSRNAKGGSGVAIRTVEKPSCRTIRKLGPHGRILWHGK